MVRFLKLARLSAGSLANTKIGTSGKYCALVEWRFDARAAILGWRISESQFCGAVAHAQACIQPVF
jgi:hypothetical protein